jgi:AraC-like DNA-binding protein
MLERPSRMLVRPGWWTVDRQPCILPDMAEPPSPAIPASPVDPLGEALHLLRMTGVFYCRSEFTAPWGLVLPPFTGCMMFHVVTAGECWLDVDGAAPRLLRPGDLALVPHGEGHRLVSELGAPTAALFDVPRELLSDRYELLRHGGGGAPTTVVCGVVRFHHPAAQHLVRLLPRLIAVDAWDSSEGEWLQSTLRFMAVEARELRPGGDAVITRLADILIVQVIRSWLARDSAAQTGWVGALRDKQIGRAIALIHRDPARVWTLSSLATEIGMSRSAFAARFTRLVGEPAMHYAARWKMQAAAMWLEEDDPPLGELASRLGYESEAAFSRAFKRFIGVSPGAARRRDQPLPVRPRRGETKPRVI